MKSRDIGNFSTISDVAERFLRLEDEYALLDERIDDVQIWGWIRLLVYRRIIQSLEITGQEHSDNEITKASALYRLCRNLAFRNPLFADSSTIVVWGHERRKQRESGLWEDIYCDPVIDALDEPVTYIERPHEGGHLKPPVTDDVRYLDLIQYAPHIPRKILGDRVLLSKSDQQRLDEIQSMLESAFGVEVELHDLVGRMLLRRRVQVPLYETMLRRVDPELALLVVSYSREPFVEACRRHGIPTIELQHGVISRYHLGYSYPGARTKELFPDYLFAFGDFWRESVEFPIPTERIYAVGYPHLEESVASYSDLQTTEQVVFVSQGSIGTRLSKFALEVAEKRPKLDVVYKLHPGEYSRWRNDYPWLIDAPLTVVADETPLHELFATSSVQVAVYSTTIYEGFCFGLETYLVDLPGVSWVEHLLDEGAATLISSPDELIRNLDSSESKTVDTDQFFEPNALQSMRTALEDIRRREQ